MSNGASRYRVSRHRKHSEFKNSLIVEVAGSIAGELPIDLSRGTDAETQKVLEGILGCSYEVFMAAVYSGQEAMPDLPKMKDKELKTLIEEAAGMQRIERAYELAREKSNEAKTAHLSATHIRDMLQEAKVTKEQALERAEAAFATWESGKADRVNDSALAIARAQNALDIAQADVDAVEIGVKKATARIADIDVSLARHKALDAAAVIAERAVRTAEMAIDTGALKRLQADVKRCEEKIANAATEIKKPCTECGTVLETMPLDEFIAHNERHLAAAKKKLADAKVLAMSQMEEVKSSRETAATLRSGVPDVTALITERATLVKVIENGDKIKAALTRAEADKKAAVEQELLRSSEKNPHERLVEDYRTALTEAVSKVAAAQTNVETTEQAAKITAAVVKVFGPAGVRAQILDTVTPFLNERTGDYLSALSDGEITATWTTLTKSAAGELKEKFSLDVTHAKGGDSFIALSGGEKRKVRLATALALQDLVASRATQPIDLWIGDEVDDALDPAGLERLMTILDRKAKERGTVLVISHSDLRDWIDNVTTVRKEAQWSSTVEGSLCS